MDEIKIMECLKRANAQIEMARRYYMEDKDNAVFETEFGTKFKQHLAETIKNCGLAQCCLGIAILEEEIDQRKRNPLIEEPV